ncbi:MAG TPA: transcription termination factor Rho [Candidatus Limnocylindria bacterium]|nr:transcription termination factor Rho [Candidatus Limnocylindria bacterium]
MRPRRRRPRGPRPTTPGTPGETPAAGAPTQLGPRPAGRRRRRRSGNNRPINSSPGPYAGANSGGREATTSQRPPSPGPRRGGRRGRSGPRGNGPGERRRGLEVLRDLQQIGVALDPTERLLLELPPGKAEPPYGDRITGRAIDLIAPIGRGQRCLIVSPPKAGKTRILQIIAASVAFNHPEVGIYALLVDERPEEVTDFRRNTPAEVIAASSDMSVDEHIETAEHAMEVVASKVLEGKDVVLLLDSITRLARAYNAGAEGSGRTMSGGLDSAAMQAPRQIFGAARKIEDAGSLTIVGTALVDTGSRMDQVIFEEFKGTGNMELVLSRELAEKRIYPAIDIAKSGTRKEEKLYPPEIVPRLHLLRRGLAGLHPVEAMTKLLELLTKLKSNQDIFDLLKS